MLLRHPPTLHSLLSLLCMGAVTPLVWPSSWIDPLMWQISAHLQVVFYVVQHIGMLFIWCGLAAILLAAIILDWDRLA